MAKRKVNKSKEVRQFLKDNPDVGPSEVAKTLKHLGISPNFVSNVKMKMKLKSTGGKSKQPDFDALIAAAGFIKACGGVDNAKEALRIAEQVVASAE